MRLTLVFIAVLAVCVLWPGDVSVAQCPEDPNDLGICDTLYTDVHPPDVLFTGPGHLVRVPVRVTHDENITPGGFPDSIALFLIPLCYTHTNPAKYCSLSNYWNRPYLWPWPAERSIFRHLDGEINWLYDQHPEMGNYTVILDLDGTSHFWFALFPEVPDLQRWPGGSRRLLLTMTFKVEDSVTVSIDTCFWPTPPLPSNRLAFWRSDAVVYTPRDNMPYDFSVSYTPRGDANADGTVDGSDVVYLINYLFRFGPEPVPLWVGDVNCDGDVNSGDIVYLISYLFRGGPGPCEG